MPPADRLAAIRAQLKDLEEQEQQLRALLLNDPEARTGNLYVVEIQQIETSRCDLKELRAVYPDVAAQFTFSIKQPRVVLKALDQETGEITTARRRQP